MEIHVEIAAETLFHVGPIPVTNSMLTMFIVMGRLLLAGTLIARSLQEVPGRAQGLVEIIVGFILGIVEGTAGRSAARKMIPLVGGMFIFILFANWSGLFPGVGTIGVWREPEQRTTGGTPTDATHPGRRPTVSGRLGRPGRCRSSPHRRGRRAQKVLVPFFRPPNADINMTLAMALVTFTTVQVIGIRAHGLEAASSTWPIRRSSSPSNSSPSFRPHHLAVGPALWQRSRRRSAPRGDVRPGRRGQNRDLAACWYR